MLCKKIDLSSSKISHEKCFIGTRKHGAQAFSHLNSIQVIFLETVVFFLLYFLINDQAYMILYSIQCQIESISKEINCTEHE